MVAKAFMTLTELQNYRKYLVETENEIQAEIALVEDITTEQKAKLDWYRQEIEDADYWIEYRTVKRIEHEEEAAAQAWLHPKELTPRTWWRKVRDFFWALFR